MASEPTELEQRLRAEIGALRRELRSIATKGLRNDVAQLRSDFDADVLLGFRFLEEIRYEADDTFVKADFVGLRMVEVLVQGDGGGSGGCQGTVAGQGSASGGGGGGGFSRKLVPVEALLDEEDITVGQGGAGGGAGNNNGSAGTGSSFGSHASATGGGGGSGSGVTSFNASNPGGTGGTASGGDFNVQGGYGGYGNIVGGFPLVTAYGGASMLGPSVRPGDNAQTGRAFGGGAGGGRHGASTAAKAGAPGGRGIVIVRLYG